MDNSYKAPEYYTQTPIKGPPLDMWAVGVVYFALLHGRFPFFGRSVSQGFLHFYFVLLVHLFIVVLFLSRLYVTFSSTLTTHTLLSRIISY